MYIYAGQISDNNIVIGDTSETDITSKDHNNDISDGALMLVGRVDMSVELLDIPLDMYPNELLHSIWWDLDRDI